MLAPKGLRQLWALLIGGDLTCVVAAVYASIALTDHPGFALQSIYGPAQVAATMAVLHLTLIYFQDLYTINHPRTEAWVVASTMMATVKLAIVLGVVVMAIPALAVGRIFLLAYITISGAALVGWRFTANTFFFARFNIRVMALGFSECAPALIEELERCSHLGYRFLGFAAWDGGAGCEVVAAPLPSGFDVHPIPPTAHPIDDLTRTYNANVLVLLDRPTCNGGIRELVRCRMRGTQLFDFESFYERITGKLPIPFLKESWLLSAPGFVWPRWRHQLKRIVDIAAAVLIGAFAVPVFVLTAIAIKLDSAGPVLYWQERVGRDERVFRVCKFRSMTVDAEKTTGAVWASERDPRVTRVGRVIRRFRIDELPQLLNVLRGEMSLVGPRPERPEIVAKLAEAIQCYDYRHFVRPGITGWAQICYPYGATLEDAQQKLAYDLYYLKNWSLMLDLQIMLQTVKVVLFGRGAR